MSYGRQIERDIENMLFRIEMDMDVEASMLDQIERIEKSPEFPNEPGFRLIQEDDPAFQVFPLPYHFRFFFILSLYIENFTPNFTS